MDRERHILHHWNGRPEGGRASPEGLDSQADALWAYAGDCDRWGLASDAAAARRKTVEMRVGALLGRALLAGAEAAEDGDPA